MINYSLCKDIQATTTDSGRIYHTPIGDFPSITTVLSKTANNVWLQKWIDRVGIEEAARISKEATDRGTLIHSYLERFWNEDDILSDLLNETSDVQHMTRNLVQATQKNISKMHAQEIALWSPTIKYAGRCDGIGEWNGVLSIIDYKTSKKNKYAKDIKDYFIQCAAYAQAHNELFKTNIKQVVILITVEGGEVQVFTGNMLVYVPDLKYRVSQYYKLHHEE